VQALVCAIIVCHLSNLNSLSLQLYDRTVDLATEKRGKISTDTISWINLRTHTKITELLSLMFLL